MSCFWCYVQICLWENLADELIGSMQLLLWPKNYSGSSRTWTCTNGTGGSFGKKWKIRRHLEYLPKVYLKVIYPKLSVWSLRAWKKLKEVLQSWIQTSGRDDQSENNTVCQEIKEVRLSPDWKLDDWGWSPKDSGLSCFNEVVGLFWWTKFTHCFTPVSVINN